MLHRRKTKWCCSSFKARYEKVGEQGLGVLVDRGPEGHPRFLLQHRAVDAGQKLPSTGSVSVALVTDVGMAYCPWCGRNLEKFYKRKVDQLHRPGLTADGSSLD